MTRTSVADHRWHQIPSPQDRINKVENLIIDVYTKIADLHKTNGQLRWDIKNLKDRIQEIELELEHERQFQNQ